MFSGSGTGLLIITTSTSFTKPQAQHFNTLNPLTSIQPIRTSNTWLGRILTIRHKGEAATTIITISYQCSIIMRCQGITSSARPVPIALSIAVLIERAACKAIVDGTTRAV
jgi:hypothetical protein